MDILATFFDIHDMKPETTFKLKQIFDALDRPEFLCSVPKVSNSLIAPASHCNLHKCLTLFSLPLHIVLKSARNSFKCGNVEGMHDFTKLWADGLQNH